MPDAHGTAAVMGNVSTVMAIVSIVVFILALSIGVVARVLVRATKETAVVRTGLGGRKVIMNSVGLCVPILQEKILVNMNTLRMPLSFDGGRAVVTRDGDRAAMDLDILFRVSPTPEAVSTAAQTLGTMTFQAEMLSALVADRVGEQAEEAVRRVAAGMDDRAALWERRRVLTDEVRRAAGGRLAENGLEVELVIVTRLEKLAPS